MKKRPVVKGTLILVLSGLIVRGIGFFYRIYLTTIIGAEGMGLFQLISPVYSLIILTLTSGISTAVSRMTAVSTARKQYQKAGEIVSTALFIVVAAGIFAAILLFFNASFISSTILNEKRTYLAMKMLVPCIPVVAAAAALKGYFYGKSNFAPSAVSSIIEQIVKISSMLIIAGTFIEKGLEYACSAAILAMAIGEMAGLLVLIIFFTKVRTNKGLYIEKSLRYRKKNIINEMMKIALPISGNRLVTSLMSTMENILIPLRLAAGGMDKTESISTFGKLSGMAMPLVFFPAIVTSAIATTLIPSISEDIELKKINSANKKIASSIKIAVAMGAIFTALFISYPDKISECVYKGQDIGSLIFLMAYSCVFIYLHQTMLGILNGLGKQNECFWHTITGCAFRIASIYFLLPIYGINSYIISITISLFVICILDIITIIKTTKLILDIRNWVLKPIAGCIILAISGKYIYNFISKLPVKHSYLTYVACVVFVGIGVVLMNIFKLINLKDILKAILPEKGKKN